MELEKTNTPTPDAWSGPYDQINLEGPKFLGETLQANRPYRVFRCRMGANFASKPQEPTLQVNLKEGGKHPAGGGVVAQKKA